MFSNAIVYQQISDGEEKNKRRNRFIKGKLNFKILIF